MTDVTPHKVVLKSPFGRYDEGRAAGAITPGHLVKLNGDLQLIKQDAAGEQVERAFAIEDALQGKTIDDAYASGDLVRYWLANPGDEVYAWLSDGENVSAGDQLMSNGDGTLAALSNAGTAYTNAPVAVALEDVDLATGTAAADGRIKVRVI